MTERFVCPECGAASSDPDDIRDGYCGNCHYQTGVPDRYALWKEEREATLPRCAHCGRLTGDYLGGVATVEGRPVCHPNAARRPDCYRLVTVYRERLGCRLAMRTGE